MVKFGSWYDDLSVGQKISHPSERIIDEDSNLLFCEITSNHHPLHTDADFAEKTQHGQLVVPGTYVLSLAVGLTVPEISGKAIANLSYSNIEHLKPTFIGDKIRVKSMILEKRRSVTKPDRGIVMVESQVFNQKDEKVMLFRRAVMIPVED